MDNVTLHSIAEPAELPRYFPVDLDRRLERADGVGNPSAQFGGVILKVDRNAPCGQTHPGHTG